MFKYRRAPRIFLYVSSLLCTNNSKTRRLSLSLSDDVGRLAWTNYTNASCVNKFDPSCSSKPHLMVRRRYAPCYSLGSFLSGLTFFDTPSLSLTLESIACCFCVATREVGAMWNSRSMNRSLPEGLINVY